MVAVAMITISLFAFRYLSQIVCRILLMKGTPQAEMVALKDMCVERF